MTDLVMLALDNAIKDDDKRNKLILGDIHTSSRANYSDKIIIKIKINYV